MNFRQAGKLAGDHRIGIGIDLAERQFLQLLAHRMHANAAGERRIDLHGLGGDALALFRLDMVEGAHVVQAVGELNQ